MSTATPSESSAHHRHKLWAFAAWTIAVAAVGLFVGRFWIPLDDGTLAQSAERVLFGQLPHRDFYDPYTGLNALLGALAFRVLGTNLMSLRIPLVVGFALWLPAVWLLARRFVGVGPALVATAIAATLSVLAYPAAMPTWFALFAVTWGVWFLTRFFDRGGRGWLLAVGATAGAAILFKVVGLYFVASILLSLAWHRCTVDRVPFLLVSGACTAFLLLLGALVLRGFDVPAAYHFVLPALALCLSLTAISLRQDPEAPPGGAALASDGLVVVAGALIPIALFLVPYAGSGSAGPWFEGVFLLPGHRFAFASSRPGDTWSLVPGIAGVAFWSWTSHLSRRGQRRAAIGLLTAFTLGLALDDLFGGAVIGSLWYALRGWISALTCWGAWLLARRSGPQDPAAFALLATAGLWALVQFPYTAPAYFFYVAPLGVLATVAVASLSRRPAVPVLAVMAGIAAFLGAGYVTGVSRSGTTELALERGGIRVSASDAELYGELVEVVGRHLGGGTLWAGPDAPEVYFLTGAPNPTPTLYEFLYPLQDGRPIGVPPYGSPDVEVVVVNTRPLFSDALDADEMDFLIRAFPESTTLDPFVIRWRAP